MVKAEYMTRATLEHQHIAGVGMVDILTAKAEQEPEQDETPINAGESVEEGAING